MVASHRFRGALGRHCHGLESRQQWYFLWCGWSHREEEVLLCEVARSIQNHTPWGWYWHEQETRPGRCLQHRRNIQSWHWVQSIPWAACPQKSTGWKYLRVSRESVPVGDTRDWLPPWARGQARCSSVRVPRTAQSLGFKEASVCKPHSETTRSKKMTLWLI